MEIGSFAGFASLALLVPVTTCKRHMAPVGAHGEKGRHGRYDTVDSDADGIAPIADLVFPAA